MISVTVTTNKGRHTKEYDEWVTPRQIFKDLGVDYGTTVNSLDGQKLTPRDLDKSLSDLTHGDECRISAIVKQDNAAKVKIVGATATVVSAVKLADWQKVSKYAPATLKIVDPEDKEDVLFSAYLSGNAGSVGACQVVWGKSTTKDGYATATILMDGAIKEKKEKILDNFGAALDYINTLESRIAPKITEIDTKRKAQAEAIEEE